MTDLRIPTSRFDVFVAGGAALVAIIVLIRLLVSWRRGRARRWLVGAAFATSLAINAEGMWLVATERLHLPHTFAGAVFFVFEAILLAEMSLASEQYQRTSIRDTEGRLVAAGHPGKHGRAVWVIAVVSGLIVAFNARSGVEVALRVALPLAVTMLWWNALTAEGTSQERTRFPYGPTQLARRWGLVVADEDQDLTEMARQRRLRALVAVGYRDVVEAWPRGWHRWRLGRLARGADDAMVDEARAQVDRVRRIAELLATPVATEVATEPASEVATQVATELASRLATELATELATTVATEVANRLATELASRPAKRVATTPASQVATQVATRTASVAADDLPESAKTIAKLRARKPDITQAEVVAKLAPTRNVSARTVQRYWADTTPPPPPADPANGTDASHLLPTGSR